MLETLNNIKNELKARAEKQRKLRIVLGQNHANFEANYRKVFQLKEEESMPYYNRAGYAMSAYMCETRKLFELYTAYYIVKHRLYFDYSEYKSQVTEKSYLHTSFRYQVSDFWFKVQRYVEKWTMDIFYELEKRKSTNPIVKESIEEAV